MPSASAPITIGLDLGTSGAKALALDATGTVLAVARARYPLVRLAPGWAEQDPAAWWRAACAALRALLRDERVARRTVAGVGLSGQMHGATLLDVAGQPVRPSLIWADERGAAELAALGASIMPNQVLEITGSLPYASATLAKLLWLRAHEPASLAHAAHMLLAKDAVRWRLTGAYATDPSDAAGTQFYDVRQGAWSPVLLAAAGYDAALLPPVLPSAAVAGTLTGAAARATGLPRGVPVVTGGGDAACAAFGLGLGERAAPGAGEALLSIGTAGQVALVVDRPLIAANGAVQTFSYVQPGRWLMAGALLSAGHALAWLAGALAGPAAAARRQTALIDQLLDEAADTAPGAAGLIFLPHLLGERGPHTEVAARGAFAGLRADHTRGHLARAVVEGVTLALRPYLDALRTLGCQVDQALVAGAPSRHPLWRQVLADALGLPIAIAQSEHGSALGAARLAACATLGDPFQSAPPHISITHSPQPAAMRRYDELYAIYQSLSAALLPTFRALGALHGMEHATAVE